MSLTLETITSKIIAAVAGAALIGGGTVVLTTAQQNSIQNHQIAELQDKQRRAEDATDRLSHAVQNLDKNVAVLNDRMKVAVSRE